MSAEVDASRQRRKCDSCKRLRPLSAFSSPRRSGRRGGVKRKCDQCRTRHRNAELPESPRYWIRHHAIERYIERVAPNLTRVKAKDEMVQAMEGARMTVSPPWWHAAGRARPGVGLIEGYIRIDSSTVFAVGCYPGERKQGQPPRVKTVLIRESFRKIARRRMTFVARRTRVWAKRRLRGHPRR